MLFCCGVLCFQSRLAVATLFCPDSSTSRVVFESLHPHATVLWLTKPRKTVSQHLISEWVLWVTSCRNVSCAAFYYEKHLQKRFQRRKRTLVEFFRRQKRVRAWKQRTPVDEHWFNRNDSDLVSVVRFFQKSNLVMSDIVLKCPLSSLQTRKVTSKTFPASKTDLSTSCSGVKTCSWAENNEYWSGGHL